MFRSLFIASLIIPAPLADNRNAVSKPEDQVAVIIEAFMKRQSTDWDGLEAIPGIRWAPLPPQSLKECLPDGGCFTRLGQSSAEGRTMNLMATGARTIVSNLYIRNMGTPVGGEAVLTALEGRGVSSTLARCPMKGGTGVTSWYRAAISMASKPLSAPNLAACSRVLPGKAAVKNPSFICASLLNDCHSEP